MSKCEVLAAAIMNGLPWGWTGVQPHRNRPALSNCALTQYSGPMKAKQSADRMGCSCLLAPSTLSAMVMEPLLSPEPAALSLCGSSLLCLLFKHPISHQR